MCRADPAVAGGLTWYICLLSLRRTSNPDAKVPADRNAKIPFFVASISSVMHPWNPHCPTMHFNYRCACSAVGGLVVGGPAA